MLTNCNYRLSWDFADSLLSVYRVEPRQVRLRWCRLEDLQLNISKKRMVRNSIKFDRLVIGSITRNHSHLFWIPDYLIDSNKVLTDFACCCLEGLVLKITIIILIRFFCCFKSSLLTCSSISEVRILKI